MITIMTAAENAKVKQAARQRVVKGTDFRCHNGARSLVHKRHNAYKRFGGKERREAMKGD